MPNTTLGDLNCVYTYKSESLIICGGNIDSNGFCDKCQQKALTSSNLCSNLIPVQATHIETEPTYTEAQIREACEAIGLVDYGINKLLTKLKEK